MRSPLHRAVAPLALSLLFLTREALAQEPQPAGPAFRLEYTAPESCPRADSFVLAVNSEATHEMFSATAQERIVVTVRRIGRLYQPAATHLDAAGVEVWTTALDPIGDCVDAVYGLAFVTRIHIDPPTYLGDKPPLAREPQPSGTVSVVPRHPHRLFGTDGEPAPAVALAVPVPIENLVVPAEKPAELPEEPRAVHLRVGGAVGATFGSAPGPALATAVDFGVRWRMLSIAVEGRYDAPASGEERGGHRVTVARYAAALVPCGHLSVLVGCLVGEVGLLRATGDADLPKTASGRTMAGGGRIGVEVPVHERFAVRVSVEALKRTRPVALDIDQRAVWSGPGGSVAATAGLLASF